MVKNQRLRLCIHAQHGATGEITVAALDYVTEEGKGKLAGALMVVQTNPLVYAKQAAKGLPKLS